jgi:carbonic anhydrase
MSKYFQLLAIAQTVLALGITGAAAVRYSRGAGPGTSAASPLEDATHKPLEHGHAEAERPNQADHAAIALDLLRGNARLGSGAGRFGAIKEELAKVGGLRPAAMVLTCTDSETNPEVLLDRPPGDLFVVRTPAATLDAGAVGALEYAAHSLGVEVLVVLGHAQCGIVAAAASGEKPASPSLKSIQEQLSPALKSALGRPLEEATRQAVENQVVASSRAILERSELLRGRAVLKRLAVLGAVYDGKTGSVRGVPEASSKGASWPEVTEPNPGDAVPLSGPTHAPGPLAVRGAPEQSAAAAHAGTDDPKAPRAIVAPSESTESHRAKPPALHASGDAPKSAEPRVTPNPAPLPKAESAHAEPSSHSAAALRHAAALAPEKAATPSQGHVAAPSAASGARPAGQPDHQEASPEKQPASHYRETPPIPTAANAARPSASLEAEPPKASAGHSTGPRSDPSPKNELLARAVSTEGSIGTRGPPVRADARPDAEAVVRNGLHAALPAIEACYESELRRNERLRGKILVAVAVHASGIVASSRITESTLQNPVVLDCIRSRLNRIRFPPPGEEVEVTLPLTLVSRE